MFTGVLIFSSGRVARTQRAFGRVLLAALFEQHRQKAAAAFAPFEFTPGRMSAAAEYAALATICRWFKRPADDIAHLLQAACIRAAEIAATANVISWAVTGSAQLRAG